MKKLLLAGTVIAGILVLAPATANAQCGYYPYSYCGGVYVAPQPVYVAPQPVYVATPPPTVIVAQPAPAPVAAVEASPYVRARGFGFGVRATAGYAGGNELAIYGGGALLRYIATPHFGLELSADFYGADDGDGAMLIPIGMSGLVFFNTRRHLQPYLIAGLNTSILECEHSPDSFLYVGGHAGVGAELLIGRRVGLTLEARGFVQGQVHADDELEYGVTFNTGFNFYL